MIKSNRMAKLASSKGEAAANAAKTIHTLVDNKSIESRFSNAEEILHLPESAGEGEQFLDISSIDDNPYNARAFYKQEEIDRRMKSISKDGQLDAVKVALHPISGKLTMIDGQYRKRALLALGRGQILSKVLKIDTIEDFYRLSFASNSERYQQTALDNAVVWSKLLEDGVYKTEEELAKAINTSPATVNKVLSIMTLPPAAIDFMKESPEAISWGVAYEVVLYHREVKDPAATELLIQRVITEGLSKRAVEEIKKSATLEKPDRVHRMSRQYKIKDLPGVTGNLKDWDDGRLMLDLKVTDPEIKMNILNLIKNELKIK